MSEYIERAAAIECAEESYKMWNLAMAAAEGAREINKCYKWQDVCEAIGETFKIVPAADVAPVVHGKWIRIDDPEFICGDFECSNCSHREYDVDTDELMPGENCLLYCPNCGAKMDEGTRNDG